MTQDIKGRLASAIAVDWPQTAHEHKANEDLLREALAHITALEEKHELLAAEFDQAVGTLEARNAELDALERHEAAAVGALDLMGQAVIQAADWFFEYEALHRVKGTDDASAKADTNEHRALWLHDMKERAEAIARSALQAVEGGEKEQGSSVAESAASDASHPNCSKAQHSAGLSAPEPPWLVGKDNAKREGWKAFFSGRQRGACPFPMNRSDLQRDYRVGWDLAADFSGRHHGSEQRDPNPEEAHDL